jgi:molybdopterin synthase catalytic subunit
MGAISRLETNGLDPAAELAAFLSGRSQDGAVVSFVGLTRERSRDGGEVESLRLDWYPGMTEAALRALVEAGCARFEVTDLLAVHRCGDLRPGEPIVFVAAAAPHRRPAFEAVDYLMDRLKAEAAFWKRETAGGEAAWVEPTAADRAALARWS